MLCHTMCVYVCHTVYVTVLCVHVRMLHCVPCVCAVCVLYWYVNVVL